MISPNLTPPMFSKPCRSYKGHYPFCLATTSFIYPATWVTNVERLGPYVDEIELLVLESGREHYPSKNDIKELAHLANEMNLSYNIHLPMDIYLGHERASLRQEAVDVVRKVVELVNSLPVSVYVIHVVWSKTTSDRLGMIRWQESIKSSFESIISTGISAASLAVETLDYPLDRIDSVIYDLGLAVCLDLGHLWLAGRNPVSYYQKYQQQTRILHLHGIENGKDHRSLDRLDSNQKKDVGRILSEFKGVVSLEVFSLDHLIPSLLTLETIAGKRDEY
jgi:sugar phosphate isomerase/epimerase